ncbi:MAG: hypothetical protein FWG75_05005 [Cystobacterineae bacterium]|nr:hypothetical protein [Cystobacterineae bacterium]
MKKKIGEILIAHKIISAEDMGEALALQVDGDPSRLGEILIQQGRLEADALARALAEQKMLPYTELSMVSSSVAQVLPLSFQQRHGLIPFEEASPGEFCIAVADPMATDAIERARSGLSAKSIRLYVASSDEIERVLSALGDNELASGEVLLSSGTESSQKQPELVEEDLFDALGADEPLEDGFSPAVGLTQQELRPLAALDEKTQIAWVPGPPAETNTVLMKPARKPSVADEREKTPKLGSIETLPSLSPFAAQLAKLLSGKGAAELSEVVVALADLLVSKSILSREEVLDIFASSPAEKW